MATDEDFFCIRARDGTQVRIYYGEGPVPPGRAEIAQAELRLSRMPSFVRRRGPDLTYNCHGLTLGAKLGWLGEDRRPDGAPRLALPVTYQSPPQLLPGQTDVVALLRGNGYRRSYADHLNLPIPAGVDIGRGDIVVYSSEYGGVREIKHSAVVVEVRDSPRIIRVLSKCGAYGEYEHNHSCVPPEYGSYFEVYSDRS